MTQNQPGMPPVVFSAASAAAAFAAAAAAAAVEEAPGATSADKDESVEITETLSRLADLRDEGAISAEEYEKKKAELLGRL